VYLFQDLIFPITNTSQQPSPSEGWTDDEVIERIKRAPPLPDAVYSFGTPVNAPAVFSHRLFILCPDTVAKIGPPYHIGPEATALNFVRSNTSIPVPKVRRYITSGEYAYVLLEKIEGTRLDRLWPSFTPLQRFITAWTLRGYILELRRASGNYKRRHVPGPMADTPQRCHGPPYLFNYRYQGPFECTRELLDFFNKSPLCMNSGTQLDDSYASQPLVLMHNDLSMRNIIVGHDGRLWLVDWEWSGFYPPFCELISMQSAAINDQGPKSWWDYIPLIAGPWFKEQKMLGLDWMNNKAVYSRYVCSQLVTFRIITTSISCLSKGQGLTIHK
jgi:Phosphotransferase enzyme family